jgi:hypothetical protein
MKGRYTVAAISALCFSMPAFGKFNMDTVRPGIGLDVGAIHQPFETSFGEEHFRRHYPYTDGYLSFRFGSYFGIEAGYQNQYRQQRNQFYPPLAPALGFVNTVDLEPKLFISEVSGHGWNLNLLGYWPVCPKLHTEIMGLIGMSRLNMTYYTTIIENGVAASPIATWESGHDSLLRLGIGVNQPITNNFGVRFLGIWQRTKQLDATFAVPVGQGGELNPFAPNDFYQVNPKNSFIVSLGLYFVLDAITIF